MESQVGEHVRKTDVRKKSETIFTETEKVRKNRNGAETKISKNQGTLLWQKQGFRALFISTALKKLSWIVL